MRTRHIAVLVRAAQLRGLTQRMAPTDFLPDSDLGHKVDAALKALANAVLLPGEWAE